VNTKIRKLLRDPIAYCLDSRRGWLREWGQRAYEKQTRRYEVIGRVNAHRKITVIMTAYNTGGLVEGAVKSVLAQTHKNFELMIFDDASTDNTRGLLQGIAARDARIRVFHSPKNHGTYWSKNWCLSKANTEFVTFHDSDDVSDPMRLQMQLGAMLDKGGAVASTCRWNRVDPAGNELSINDETSRTAVITLMINRAAVIERVGYFDTVRIAADTEYMHRIETVFGDKRLRPMRQRLYTGLLRDSSLTRGKDGGFHWKEEGTNIRRSISGDRAAYNAAFHAWHNTHKANKDKLLMPFPLEMRRFEAPASITRDCDDMNMMDVMEVNAATYAVKNGE